MPIIQINIQFERPPGSLNRDYAEARRQAFDAALRHWHQKYLPMHFELGAYTRYGYQPRSGQTEGPTVPRQYLDRSGKLRYGNWKNNPKYFWRKFREKKHMLPNVFTGQSRAIAENPGNFQVREGRSMTSKGVIVGLPKYFFQYHKGDKPAMRNGSPVIMAKQPDKKAELETLRDDEIADMVDVAQRRFDLFFSGRHTVAA